MKYIHEKTVKDVLTMSEDTSLENVGGLNTQLVLVLGVAALIILVLMVAGARSIGKVSMGCIPLCFMLMVTLVIRFVGKFHQV